MVGFAANDFLAVLNRQNKLLLLFVNQHQLVKCWREFRRLPQDELLGPSRSWEIPLPTQQNAIQIPRSIRIAFAAGHHLQLLFRFFGVSDSHQRIGPIGPRQQVVGVQLDRLTKTPFGVRVIAQTILHTADVQPGSGVVGAQSASGLQVA